MIVKKRILLVLFAFCWTIPALVPLYAEDDLDSLMCTEDGSNGITCFTVEDNECYAGGQLTWESGNGPCEQGIDIVWECGWYLARVNNDHLSSLPPQCGWLLPDEEVSSAPSLICLNPNPGTKWIDCLLGNMYYGDNPNTASEWDLVGPVIPVGDSCPAGTDLERQVGSVESNFSAFLIANGFGATTHKVCFNFVAS